ncbi:hypothetical protein ULMS_08460 [Patiriisocius marinistellae]|uniref:Uncharacterized protein n=1 Tax=Patiriisocius marinistellae TaxID=2494560 RepID=A0A5J4FVV5_9FLAO|nr:hypothetical protein [Patiriisocius marinistellae]GEQ85338.1 hypothetical protein ULMS_08460 [Patiriisocius marinistellae]
MKNLKNNLSSYAVIIGASIFMCIKIVSLDFNDLSFSNDQNSYGSIVAMILLIIAMILTIKFDPKNKNKPS